jgi:hypothetical protein
MGMAGSKGRMQPKPKSKPKQLEGKLTGSRGATEYAQHSRISLVIERL